MDTGAAVRCFIGPLVAYVLTREVFVQDDAHTLRPETMAQTLVEVFLHGMEPDAIQQTSTVPELREEGLALVSQPVHEVVSNGCDCVVVLTDHPDFDYASVAQAARSAEAQATFAGRIEHLRVSDVMDAEPVAVPETLDLARAENEFFLRYRWPWFPVVDADGHLVGVVSHEAVQSVAEQVRPSRPVASVMARDEVGSGLRVGLEEPVESLLGQEGLARLGAIMAVDRDGVLRGIVTVEALRRALRGAVTV